MKKRILIIIAAAALAALIALSVMAFSPAKQANAKAAKTAKAEATGFDFKDGAYTSDATPAYLVIHPEDQSCIVNVHHSPSSIILGGQYTVANDRFYCAGYTFRMLEDGGLEFIESESPYVKQVFEFSKENPPYDCDWIYKIEDGTVFRFDPDALSVMAFAPTDAREKAEKSEVRLKSGVYGSDLTPAYIVLDTEESFAYLNFYGPISSYAHGGRYTIEDGKLRCGGYTFRILRDGGLEFIESESPYPGMAFFPNWLYTFEDGTVFRFDPNARLI